MPEERYEGRVLIAGVAQESPAERAGLLGGDIILEADGHEVYNTETLRYRILLNLGQETDFLVMRPERLITGSFGFSADAGPVDDAVRDTEPFAVRLVPRWDPPEGQGNVGVQIRTIEGRVVSHSGNVLTAIPNGFVRMWETVSLFRNEVTSWFAGSSGPQFAGPVGIAQVSEEVAEAGLATVTGICGVAQHKPRHCEHVAAAGAGWGSHRLRCARVGPRRASASRRNARGWCTRLVSRCSLGSSRSSRTST